MGGRVDGRISRPDRFNLYRRQNCLTFEISSWNSVLYLALALVRVKKGSVGYVYILSRDVLSP